MKMLFYIIALCLFGSFIAGCGSSGGGFSGNVYCGSSDTTKTWTVFVYGHGDHNLSGELDNDITKMANATIGSNIHFVVAADWNSTTGKRSGIGNYPTGTEWYLVTGGGKKTLINTVAEQNFDDPAVLKSAVTCVFKNYPAEHYGIVIWNHGGAWDGGYGGDTQNGAVTEPTPMPIAQIQSALSEGLTAASISASKPLDFLGFDTCLFGSAEMAYLMSNLTKTYIGNAEIDYGSGWAYDTTFTALGSDPRMTPQQFAAMEVTKWEALHSQASPSDIYLRSHIAIDTTKIDDFKTAMSALVTSLNDGGATLTYRKQLAQHLWFTVPAYGMSASQRTESPKYRDLGQFLYRLINDGTLGDISTKASAVRSALTAMTIGSNFGNYRNQTETPFQLALQIAFPEPRSITSAVITDYTTKAAAWNDATSWGTFLSNLSSSNPNENPTLTQTRTDNAATMTCTDSSVNAPVTFANLELARKDPDNTSKYVNYGTIYFGTIESGTANNMTWDGKIYKLQIGNATAQPSAVVPWVYIANPLNTLTANINLLGAYGQLIETLSDGTTSTSTAAILFKSNETTATAIAYLKNGMWEGSSISSYVSDNPGAKFKPALLRWDDTSIITEIVVPSDATAVELPSTGVTVTTDTAPTDTYYFKTICENAWGNATLVTDTQ